MIITGLIILAIVGTIYFLPTIAAYHAKKRNREAIALLNFFLGWTMIGWLIALIWAATKDAKN